MTNQKNIVFNFLKENSEIPVKEMFDIFNQQFPSISKTNFNFYKSKAIKQGIFVPNNTINNNTVIPNSTNTKKNREFVVETINLDNIDNKNFKVLPTNTAFDIIASKRKGVAQGATYIVTGESGAGKTTVCTNIADYLMENNKDYKAGVIQAEMDRIDWTEECLDNPRLSNLESIYMLDYLDNSNYLDILIKALNNWNFVILDSFEVIKDQLMDAMGWTSKKAETKLIEILIKASSESGCTIFAIQQWSKSGGYKGSTKIKHMLTGMIYVMFDKEKQRYLTFTKNRRNGFMQHKHLYFTKNRETGRIEFDQDRLYNDLGMEPEKNINKEISLLNVIDNEETPLLNFKLKKIA